MLQKHASNYLEKVAKGLATLQIDDTVFQVPDDNRIPGLLNYIERNRKKQTLWDSIKDGAPSTLLTTLLAAAGSAAISDDKVGGALAGGAATLGLNGLIDILQTGSPKKFTDEELETLLDKYYS